MSSLPEFSTLLASLAAHIKQSGQLTERTTLVGIHTGGVWVAEHLHQALGLTTPLGKLAVTLHRDDFDKIGLHPQARATDIPFEVSGCDILLVDDVLYTGRTIRAALNELFDFGRPARVRLVCLIDRGVAARQLPIAADWIGATLRLPPHQKCALIIKDNQPQLILQDTA